MQTLINWFWNTRLGTWYYNKRQGVTILTEKEFNKLVKKGVTIIDIKV